MADNSAPPKQSSAFLRALLNKPRSRPKGAASDEDFFSRSNHTYAIIAAEEETRRKQKAAQALLDKSRSETQERDGKRRRISGPKDLDERAAVHPNISHPLPKSPKVTEVISDSKDSLTTREVSWSICKPSERTFTASAQSPRVTRENRCNAIDLLNSDEEGQNLRETRDNDLEIQAMRKALEPSKPARSPPESDDEFPELAREARENARHKRVQEDMPHSPTAKSPCIDYLHSFDSEYNFAAIAPRPDPSFEPTVEILITSEMLRTTPLIVQRKLGQRLKEARVEWCNRQLFTPETASEVILTWRGKQIYDSTSCKGLGIGLDADGNVVQNGVKDALGEENRRIHMIAMTQENFEKLKRAKEEEAERDPDDDLEESPSERRGHQRYSEPRLRLILKAKDFDDFKLMVKLANPISRLLNAFRKSNEISEEKEVYILFDGERLEPDSTIGDNDITDMDTLEVYVR